MLLDDVLRAAETLERLDAQTSDPPRRSSSQSRCMTSWRYGASIRAPSSPPSTDAEPAERRLDLPCSDLVEHAFDELRLHGDGLAGELGEALDRTHDRRAGGLPVEPVEPERVREEARDPAGEAVELRERVLAQRDEDVDPERSRQQRREAPRRTSPGPPSSAW